MVAGLAKAGFRGAIIAAGRGERLRGAVDDYRPPLVELGGETMLVRQARMLHQVGQTPSWRWSTRRPPAYRGPRRADSAMDETQGSRYAEFDGIAVHAGRASARRPSFCCHG